ncbi:hypothetical protein CFRS1_v013533 [Colletotrichum fructicola]|nr:hypothetical protein CFRS1_v013533 [Colletotrichum fructicola]
MCRVVCAQQAIAAEVLGEACLAFAWASMPLQLCTRVTEHCSSRFPSDVHRGIDAPKYLASRGREVHE